MYKVEKVNRIQEGTSWEDIENGDGYETAYIITDENGEVIWDTTNKEIADRYMRENELLNDLALEQREQM